MTAQPRRSHARLAIAIVAAAAAVSVATLGYSYLTTATTATFTGITESCGSPGVYCGNIQLSSGSIMENGSTGTLKVTLAEVGNEYIKSAAVYVNGTVLGIPPASQGAGNIGLDVQPGQSTVLSLTIPNSTIPIQVGRTYSVVVRAWLSPPGGGPTGDMGASLNITAN